MLLHQRVSEACWDSLAQALTDLHQPHFERGLLECWGCDRDGGDSGDAVWPCRTYTLIARTMLNISDVEAALTWKVPARRLPGARE